MAKALSQCRLPQRIPNSLKLANAFSSTTIALTTKGTSKLSQALREWRRLTDRERRLDERAREIQDHMDIHATLGDHLVINITGEAAKEQWPEIERRLVAWEQGQEEAEETDG